MLLTYALLALSTSIDSIGIGITYGIREIKISKIAMIILLITSLLVSYISILTGKILEDILPTVITDWLGSIILIIMGVMLLKQAVQKPNNYDADNSKQIDGKEAISLGFALSLDSFSIGIGAGILMQSNTFWIFPVLVSTFQILFLSIGRILGVKLKRISNMPSIFWNVSAAILLILMGIFTL